MLAGDGFVVDLSLLSVAIRSTPANREHSIAQGTHSPQTPPRVVFLFPIPNTDFGLVGALRSRHPNATRTLCDRHSGELLNVAARIFGPDGCGTTFVTQTLRHSLARLDELKDPRDLRIWLLQRLVDAARRTLRFGRLRRWFHGKRAATHLRRVPYSGNLVATYRILERLSIEQRLAFCLVIVHSMRLSEAAAILRTSPAALERRLTRAHARFTRVARRDYPHLLRMHRSHASLGVQIANEQDRIPGDSQLYESDLVRNRKPSCSA